MTRRGYTILELLVVVAISALLSTIILTYGSGSRQQVALSIELTKMAQVISRAKSLAVATFNDPTACGYGVHFDYATREYYLAAYEAAPNCPSIASVTNIRALEARLRLPPEVDFGDGANKADDIFFVPPDPRTFAVIGGSLSGNATANIYLRTKDAVVAKTISVNHSGQINF